MNWRWDRSLSTPPTPNTGINLLVSCMLQEGNWGPVWLGCLPQGTPLALGEAGASITPTHQLAALKPCV